MKLMAFVHHHAPHATPADRDVCCVFHGDRLLARSEMASAVLLPDFTDIKGWGGITHATPVHVGKMESRRCWTLAVGEETAPPEGWVWAEVRSALGILTDDQAHAISCARQLLWWERRHRYCGECGESTVSVVEERARRCPACGAVFFPVASPAIIVAITRGEELLLAHNRNFRPGMFSLLAGFVDPGETIEQAVHREVREEVGIEIADLRYVTSQPWPFPNSLMLGFRARWVSGQLNVDGAELAEAAWYRRDQLPEIPRRGTVAREMIERWLRGG